MPPWSFFVIWITDLSRAVDVWSVGCILAELLGGKPFFKGRDYVDQLNQILHYLGTPNEETLSRIGSPRAQDYVRNLPFMQKVSFQSLFRQANPDALDLLDRMLAFDPSSRISVEEALEHRAKLPDDLRLPIRGCRGYSRDEENDSGRGQPLPPAGPRAAWRPGCARPATANGPDTEQLRS
jgi:serine/threonine protein kinase